MQDTPFAPSLESFRRVETFRSFEAERTNDARIVVIRHNTCLVSTSTSVALLVGANAVPAAAEPVFLGVDERDASLYLLEIGRNVEEGAALETLGVSAESAGFADPITQLGRLTSPEREVLLTALALARWSCEHRFCNVCGTPLRWDPLAWTKSCAHTGRPHRVFPRLDPATIMLVHDGERVLLGRQKAWPSGVYSTLAGFVEPGESVEAAVAREVFEEAAIRVDEVRYFASEAWPFPRSLMLGFFARARDFDIAAGDELEDARWFSRAELRELYARVSTRMPFFDTIARRLMLAWLEHRMDARV